MCYGFNGNEFTSDFEILLNTNRSFPGDIKEILLYFSPYIIFNIGAVLFSILYKITRSGSHSLTISIFSSITIFAGLMHYSSIMSPMGYPVSYVAYQFLHVLKSWAFWYMLITLPLCLYIIQQAVGKSDTFAVRKYFHFTALIVFLPCVLYSQKVLVFGANVVICLFLAVEFSKQFAGNNTLLSAIHEYESRYLDKREKTGSGLILSHLFLLLGC